MEYIAYTIKGLEEIVKDEILEKIPKANIKVVLSKRIIFEADLTLGEVIGLLTVDDLGLLVSHFQIEKLEDTIGKIDEIDFKEIYDYIVSLRKLQSTFSITIAGVGWKGLNYENLNDVISKHVQSKYGWEYMPRDHTNFDIRIFIDTKDVYISVRLTQKSLHEREYKKFSKEGSLKPTIAGAMMRLATQGKNNLKIVDCFCGSGTILCEAYISGNEVYGSDIDSESIEITKKNLAVLGFKDLDGIKRMDATKTNWQSNYFDCVISNLPWDKQIKVESIINLYESALKEYKRIIKTNGTLCVLMTKPEIFVKYIKKYFPESTIEKYPISYIGQAPTIILVKNS